MNTPLKTTLEIARLQHSERILSKTQQDAMLLAAPLRRTEPHRRTCVHTQDPVHAATTHAVRHRAAVAAAMVEHGAVRRPLRRVRRRTDSVVAYT